MITNYSSTIELDKKALANNIKFIQELIGPETKFSAVVKGNAYGHGIAKIIPALEDLGLDHFSVFSSFEAKQAHQYINNNSTIMIMGDLPDEDIPWIVENDIEFFLFNPESIKFSLQEAKRQNKKLNIHIELETGMHRHGFEEENWDDLIDLLHHNKAYYNLKGICSHFAGAESSANFKRIEGQQKVFHKGVEKFKQAHLHPERLHIASSAGVIAYPDYTLDMVRIGVLLYGLWPSKESQLTHRYKHKSNLTLKSVLSWYSFIMEIKHADPGEYIGYGNTYLAERHIAIASVPVGYGYGFSRVLSNTGRVLVHGKRLPVIGLVSMNMFLINITDVDVKIGDRVTLIGKDGEQEIKVSYFGNLSNQLNYELLTRLDKDIPRRYKEEE